MRITEIWRYPVKSMGGETLMSAEVTDLGIAGDRGWGVFDVATGTTLTARRTPELLFASARVVDGEVAITLPDGTEVGADGSAALSAWLGRDVELRSAGSGDPEVGGRYEVPLDFERDEEWVSWEGPGGAFHDSARTRVSLVSEGTLAGRERRRFRANVVVDGAGEEGFVGGSVSVGDVRLDVVKRIDRCVMVTRAQPGLDRDLDVLRTIIAEEDNCLGVGCLVAAEGEMAVGAEVRSG